MKTSGIKNAVWILDLLLAAAAVYAVVVIVSPPAAPTVTTSAAPGQAAGAAAAKYRLAQDEAGDIAGPGGYLVPFIMPASSAPIAASPTGNDSDNVTSQFSAKLIGVAVHPDPAQSCAFFESPGQGQTLKSAGDTVANARIVKILNDGVVVDIGGRRGTVRLPSSQGLTEASAAPRTVAMASMPRPEASPAANTEPSQPDAPAASADLFRSSSDLGGIPTESITPADAGGTGGTGTDAAAEEEEPDIDSMVIQEKQFAEYLRNVGKYIGEIVILSHMGPDNKLDGLYLSSVPKSSEAYKRGLRSGDIVKAVQGVAITDTSIAYKTAMQALKDKDYIIDVTLLRKGQEITLTYEIWPE